MTWNALDFRSILCLFPLAFDEVEDVSWPYKIHNDSNYTLVAG
jgi:hypothetical protein